MNTKLSATSKYGELSVTSKYGELSKKREQLAIGKNRELPAWYRSGVLGAFGGGADETLV